MALRWDWLREGGHIRYCAPLAVPGEPGCWWAYVNFDPAMELWQARIKRSPMGIPIAGTQRGNATACREWVESWLVERIKRESERQRKIAVVLASISTDPGGSDGR